MTSDASAHGSVQSIPLEDLVFLKNIPAGLDVLNLCAIAAILRKSNEPIPPVLVTPVTGTFYRVLDGRHRTVAGYIAGRTSIDCVTE